MSIRLHNLEFNYKDQTVITDLSLEIADGGILCVMGESGCGKTTLLGILTGRLKPMPFRSRSQRTTRYKAAAAEDRSRSVFSTDGFQNTLRTLSSVDQGFVFHSKDWYTQPELQ